MRTSRPRIDTRTGNRSKKFTADELEEIDAKLRSGMRGRQIAAEMGMHPATFSNRIAASGRRVGRSLATLSREHESKDAKNQKSAVQ